MVQSKASKTNDDSGSRQAALPRSEGAGLGCESSSSFDGVRSPLPVAPRDIVAGELEGRCCSEQP